MVSAQRSSAPPGAQLYGLRLAPGAAPDPRALQDATHSTDADPQVLLSRLTAALTHDTGAEDALTGLALAPDVAGAARLAGVSLRSLQRVLERAALPQPRFWSQLARARRAGRALLSSTPLIEIAADHGYSDQAHFTREMRRWFTVTPQAARNCASFAAQITALGYGDQPGGTGVHSSTQNPSVSAT